MTDRESSAANRLETWLLFTPGVVFLVLLIISMIPRVDKWQERHREATLRSNLQRIRASVSQFEGDTGVWPARLGDIVAPAGSNPKGIRPGTYKGPYFDRSGGIHNTGIPANPYVEITAPIDQHWSYTPQSGTVISIPINDPDYNSDPYTAL